MKKALFLALLIVCDTSLAGPKRRKIVTEEQKTVAQEKTRRNTVMQSSQDPQEFFPLAVEVGPRLEIACAAEISPAVPVPPAVAVPPAVEVRSIPSSKDSEALSNEEIDRFTRLLDDVDQKHSFVKGFPSDLEDLAQHLFRISKNDLDNVLNKEAHRFVKLLHNVEYAQLFLKIINSAIPLDKGDERSDFNYLHCCAYSKMFHFNCTKSNYQELSICLINTFNKIISSEAVQTLKKSLNLAEQKQLDIDLRNGLVKSLQKTFEALLKSAQTHFKIFERDFTKKIEALELGTSKESEVKEENKPEENQIKGEKNKVDKKLEKDRDQNNAKDTKESEMGTCKVLTRTKKSKKQGQKVIEKASDDRLQLRKDTA